MFIVSLLYFTVFTPPRDKPKNYRLRIGRGKLWQYKFGGHKLECSKLWQYKLDSINRNSINSGNANLRVVKLVVRVNLQRCFYNLKHIYSRIGDGRITWGTSINLKNTYSLDWSLFHDWGCWYKLDDVSINWVSSFPRIRGCSCKLRNIALKLPGRLFNNWGMRITCLTFIPPLGG